VSSISLFCCVQISGDVKFTDFDFRRIPKFGRFVVYVEDSLLILNNKLVIIITLLKSMSG
jgi:hypothetical protein